MEAVAKGHYEKTLLRKRGLEPWKRLRVQSKQNTEVMSPSWRLPQLGSRLSQTARMPRQALRELSDLKARTITTLSVYISLVQVRV